MMNIFARTQRAFINMPNVTHLSSDKAYSQLELELIADLYNSAIDVGTFCASGWAVTVDTQIALVLYEPLVK